MVKNHLLYVSIKEIYKNKLERYKQTVQIKVKSQLKKETLRVCKEILVMDYIKNNKILTIYYLK